MAKALAYWPDGHEIKFQQHWYASVGPVALTALFSLFEVYAILDKSISQIR